MLSGEASNTSTNFIVFCWTRPWLKSTIYPIWGKHTYNQYTTDAVCQRFKLKKILKFGIGRLGWPECHLIISFWDCRVTNFLTPSETWTATITVCGTLTTWNFPGIQTKQLSLQPMRKIKIKEAQKLITLVNNPCLSAKRKCKSYDKKLARTPLMLSSSLICSKENLSFL